MFDQIIYIILLLVTVAIAILIVIFVIRWFIKRIVRARYKDTQSDLSTEIKGYKSQGFENSPNAPDEWFTGGCPESLDSIRSYFFGKQSSAVNEITQINGNDINKLKINLDKILDYILNKLNHFTENYSAELVQNSFILETILKFGTTSTELINNYKAIVFCIEKIYKEDPEKKSGVNKLFLYASEVLNNQELQKIVLDNTE